jgi:hypothetical protein
MMCYPTASWPRLLIWETEPCCSSRTPGASVPNVCGCLDKSQHRNQYGLLLVVLALQNSLQEMELMRSCWPSLGSYPQAGRSAVRKSFRSPGGLSQRMKIIESLSCFTIFVRALWMCLSQNKCAELGKRDRSRPFGRRVSRRRSPRSRRTKEQKERLFLF